MSHTIPVTESVPSQAASGPGPMRTVNPIAGRNAFGGVAPNGWFWAPGMFSNESM